MPIYLGDKKITLMEYMRAYLGEKLVYDNAPLEQLVNYTMLYDGSLGESGSSGTNICQDITGGYKGFTNYSSITYNPDNMYLHYALAGGGYVGVTAKNSIDLIEFKSVISLVSLKSNKDGVRSTIQLKDPAGTSVWGGYSNTNLEVHKVFMTNNQISKIGNPVNVSVYIEHYNTNSPHIYINIYEIFAVKADDWTTLAEKAGIEATSIEDILTNSVTLLSNKNAVEFMIKRCTGDFMASAVQSSTFLTALNNSSYKTMIMANEHWSKFLSMVA